MKAPRRLTRAAEGTVYIEFLLSFLPFFLLFLGTIQLSFIVVARIVVQHAAVQAARAASVAIDDDPYFDRKHTSTRKRLSTTPKGAGPSVLKRVAGKLGGQGLSDLGLSTPSARGCHRLGRIRAAAYLPLSAISPTHAQVARWLPFASLATSSARSVHGAIGDSPLLRVLTGLAVYNRVGAAVTFPTAPGSDELRNLNAEEDIADDAVQTVRVTYLYPCNVPLVREIMCRSIVDMSGLTQALGQAAAALKNPSAKQLASTYTQWSQKFPDEQKRFKKALGELRHAEWPTLQWLMFLGDERFVVLHGEASMPNYGAPYKYASELCKTKQRGPHCEDKS